MKRPLFTLLLWTLSFGLLSAQDKPAISIDEPTKNAVIDSLCNAFDRYYVYPTIANQIGIHLKNKKAEGAYKQISDLDYFINRLMSDIRSVHKNYYSLGFNIGIRYAPELERKILKSVASKENTPDVKTEIDQDKNFHFKKTEVFPCNIGYIKLSDFSTPGPLARQTMHSAMQFVSHSDALIIDLRNCDERDPINVVTVDTIAAYFDESKAITAYEMASYFVNSKTRVGKIYNRIEDSWSEHNIDNKQELTHGLALNMPVYILVSGHTPPAGERFAYTLQNLGKAVVVGNLTMGVSNLTRGFSLGNGFVAFIPYSRSINAATNSNWDNFGVVPDVDVYHDDEKSDDDKELAITQQIILNKKLTATTNEEEKRKINYLLGYYASQRSPLSLSKSELSPFIGQYGQYKVILQNNQLMVAEVYGRTVNYVPMRAISPTLFQVGEAYQLEFIKENGKCTSFMMHFKTGYVDQFTKDTRK